MFLSKEKNLLIRKTRLFTLILLIFFLFISNGFPEVAVIPYGVENPSVHFPVEKGEEYARLLAVTLLIKKGIPVTSPGDVSLDLKRLSLDPQGVITGDDLKILGKRGYIDHFLLGRITRIKGQYLSESTLYSVQKNRVEVKIKNKSGNLLKLAEKDIDSLFIHLPDKYFYRKSPDKIDLTILQDLSYNVSREWESIKWGIEKFVNVLSDNWNSGININIVPFSNSLPVDSKLLSISSPLALKEKLNRLSPRGANSEKSLGNAVAFSVRSIDYRRDAKKIILLIMNTPVKDGLFIEKYLLESRRKGIYFSTLLLGNLKWDDVQRIKQLSITGGGRYYTATYYQKMYDLKGKPMEFLFEAGRVFRSRGLGQQWDKGILRDKGSGLSGYKNIDPSLEEIIYSEKKFNLYPYNMEKHLPSLADVSILKAEKVEENIPLILSRIGKNISGKRLFKGSRKLARVLVNDGEVSIWIDLQKEEDKDFFKEKASSRFYFPLGISIQKKSDSPYGININSDLIIKNISSDYIPGIIKTNFKSIIKKPDYYMDKGLLTPPIWFINLKVEQFMDNIDNNDIRD